MRRIFVPVRSTKSLLKSRGRKPQMRRLAALSRLGSITHRALIETCKAQNPCESRWIRAGFQQTCDCDLVAPWISRSPESRWWSISERWAEAGACTAGSRANGQAHRCCVIEPQSRRPSSLSHRMSRKAARSSLRIRLDNVVEIITKHVIRVRTRAYLPSE
jgi:hypothetical protein